MNHNRINQDIIRLINNKHIVRAKDLKDFTVLFCGPSETPYENGVWIVSVTVDEQYPFNRPIVKFKTKIYHPNIDRNSGEVCMNVLYENWSPIYEMLTIFEQFLPQLLKYPNPNDPLNFEAARLLLHKPTIYEEQVLKYVRRYANEKLEKNDAGDVMEDDDDTSSSSLSDSLSELFGESMANKVD